MFLYKHRGESHFVAYTNKHKPNNIIHNGYIASFFPKFKILFCPGRHYYFHKSSSLTEMPSLKCCALTGLDKRNVVSSI